MKYYCFIHSCLSTLQGILGIKLTSLWWKLIKGTLHFCSLAKADNMHQRSIMEVKNAVLWALISLCKARVLSSKTAPPIQAYVRLWTNLSIQQGIPSGVWIKFGQTSEFDTPLPNFHTLTSAQHQRPGIAKCMPLADSNCSLYPCLSRSDVWANSMFLRVARNPMLKQLHCVNIYIKATTCL